MRVTFLASPDAEGHREAVGSVSVGKDGNLELSGQKAVMSHRVGYALRRLKMLGERSSSAGVVRWLATKSQWAGDGRAVLEGDR